MIQKAVSPAPLSAGLSRRNWVGAAAASLLTAGCAQQQALVNTGTTDEALRQLDAAALKTTQGVSSSLSRAPKSAQQGVWVARAALPIPRTEMERVSTWEGRMYVVGGYDYRGGFTGTWNHVYDPVKNEWTQLAAHPKGGNHMGQLILNGKLYTIGGFTNQNNTPFADCYVYTIATNSWASVAPLPRALGSVGCTVMSGKIHAVGGRDSVSVGTHFVYDPATDKWDKKADLPGARDHSGVVTLDNILHVIGGRFNTFDYNTPVHHVWSPNTDQWKERAPMPTSRSGQGAVVYRNRIFCCGGEGAGHVFSQMESYDPLSNSWESHAPMPTPRHGMGIAVLGDAIYVAGGGAVVGGSLLTATHEAFSLNANWPASLGVKAL